MEESVEIEIEDEMNGQYVQPELSGVGRITIIVFWDQIASIARKKMHVILLIIICE